MEVLDKKSNRLDSLKKKQEQIKAQIQKMEAAESARQRKRDTRCKILVGAYYLDKAKADGTFDDLVKLMDGYLTRNSDRVLFDLDLLESSGSESESDKSKSNGGDSDSDKIS